MSDIKILVFSRCCYEVLTFLTNFKLFMPSYDNNLQQNDIHSLDLTIHQISSEDVFVCF